MWHEVVFNQRILGCDEDPKPPRLVLDHLYSWPTFKVWTAWLVSVTIVIYVIFSNQSNPNIATIKCNSYNRCITISQAITLKLLLLFILIPRNYHQLLSKYKNAAPKYCLSQTANVMYEERMIFGKVGPYHRCWCHGSLRRQNISSHGIDYVRWARKSSSSTRKYFSVEAW